MKSKGHGEPLKFEIIQAAIEGDAEAINRGNNNIFRPLLDFFVHK